MENQNETNTWLAYRKTIQIKDLPLQAIANIAVDSKYWLWINGKQVVFEGGLKRGPNANDTYYDAVDIAPYLKKGLISLPSGCGISVKTAFRIKAAAKGLCCSIASGQAMLY